MGILDTDHEFGIGEGEMVGGIRMVFVGSSEVNLVSTLLQAVLGVSRKY